MPANLPGTQRWQIKQDDRRRGAIVKMAETKAYSAWASVHTAGEFDTPEDGFFTGLISVDDAALAMGATRDDHRFAAVAYERVWTQLGGTIPGDESQAAGAIAVAVAGLAPGSFDAALEIIHAEIEKYADARGHIRRLYIADGCAREVLEAILNAGFDIVRRAGEPSNG